MEPAGQIDAGQESLSWQFNTPVSNVRARPAMVRTTKGSDMIRSFLMSSAAILAVATLRCSGLPSLTAISDNHLHW